MREESSSFKVFQGVILQHTGKTNLEHNSLWEKQLRIHFTAANMKNYYFGQTSLSIKSLPTIFVFFLQNV